MPDGTESHELMALSKVTGSINSGDLMSKSNCPYLIDFQIGVENRDYHYLSQSEIAGGKRISQHLSTRDGS